MKVVQILFVGICFLSIMSCQSDDDLDLGDNNVVDINDLPNQGNGNNGNGNGGNGNGGNGNNNNNGNNLPTTTSSVNLIELGRTLFWDPILSGEKDIACASCHHPAFGYADGRALPIGVGGQGLGPARFDATPDDIGLVGRNSPTIINTAFNGIDNGGNFNPDNAPMFWDNRERGLEAQALGPLQNFEEMRGHAFSEAVALDSIIARIQAINEYNNLFAGAFGNNNSITSQNIGVAIAAFERTITATNSPFDQFQAGDQNALSQAAQRGMARFNQVGCDDCHSGPMFSDFELHVVGVPDHELLDESDEGANGTYAFRTPTLRNLPQTGPYFHNGVGGDLEETVRFYITARNFARNNNGGGGGGTLNVNPNVGRNQIDNDVQNLGNLDNGDVNDIVSFIEALNDTDFDRDIPTSVPSGLTPGGNIE